MAWARANEKFAIKIYIDVSSTKTVNLNVSCMNVVLMHTDLDLRSFGLQLFPDKPWYGAFSDIVIYCCCCKYGCVEVKCPLPFKEKSEEICKETFYVTYDSDSEI